MPQLLLAAVRIRGFAAVFRSGCAREGADGVQTEQWRPLRSAAPLSQGPTVIKNERFTDLLPKPTTSKKVSPLHGIYAEQYHPCTPITRRKGRKSWGLGGRETLALLRGRRFGCPNSPEAREIKHTLKYDRLKLPSAFFTDKYGQVQIQTDIYEQQVYRAGQPLPVIRDSSLNAAGIRFPCFPKGSAADFRRHRYLPESRRKIRAAERL